MNKAYIIFGILIGLMLAMLITAIVALADDKLEPELVKKIKELKTLANKEGIEFRITCGYRSKAKQLELYAKGRTKAGKKVTWTKNSYHTTGKAFDIVIIKNGKVSWKPEDYFRIGELGKSIGLTWGSSWKVRDYCHFQLESA